jgi:hypothetical protein
MGLVLVLLIASSTPVQAAYTQPGTSGSLMGEVGAFVSDFGQWNAIHNGLPMKFLSMASGSDAGVAALYLFWFWLHDPQGTPIGTIGGSGNSDGLVPFGSGSTHGLIDPSGQNGSNGGAGSFANLAFGNPNAVHLDPVPEPASATMLAVGGFGLLMGWRVRSRKAKS